MARLPQIYAKRLVTARQLRYQTFQEDPAVLKLAFEQLQTPYPGEENAHYLITVALRTIARVGDHTVIPQLDTFLARKDVFPEDREYARIARARLLAEAKHVLLPDPDSRTSARREGRGKDEKEEPVGRHRRSADLTAARAKLAIYLKETGLTVERLNVATKRPDTYSTHGGENYDLIVLRTLSEMIYQRHDVLLTEAAKAAGVRFDIDEVAETRIRLTPLSRSQRVQALIDLIATFPALTSQRYRIIGLAEEEGTLASNAAAQKLLEMKKNRDKYPHYAAFEALLRTIGGIGDATQLDVVNQFTNDPEPWILQDAKRIASQLRVGAIAYHDEGY